jgi:LacI family transcriptional regulator
VAREAGVSQATVSMALGGTGASLPAETRERVSRAARDLGYAPNRIARALKTSRTMTVACIVPDITNPFYPALIRGIQSVTDAEGYDLVTMSTDGAAAREAHVLDWGRQGRCDGIVGVFWTLTARDLAGMGVPVVRVENSRKHGGALPIDDLFVDGRAAAEAMTRLLIARGHRRIGMIAGRGGPQATRIEGFRAALGEAGLPALIELDDAFNEEGGHRAAAAMLASSVRPTAIFAANDLMAIGALQAAAEAGLAVPGDLAVAGFDDIPAARLVTPPLTTVCQFECAMGARAARLLLDRLGAARGDAAWAPGIAHEMPFSLVERRSA